MEAGPPARVSGWTSLTSRMGGNCSEGVREWMMVDFGSQVSVRLMVEAEVDFRRSPHRGNVSSVGHKAVELSISGCVASAMCFVMTGVSGDLQKMVSGGWIRALGLCLPMRWKASLYMSAMRDAASGDRACAHEAVKMGRKSTGEPLVSTKRGVLQRHVYSESSVFMSKWGNLAPGDNSACEWLKCMDNGWGDVPGWRLYSLSILSKKVPAEEPMSLLLAAQLLQYSPCEVNSTSAAVLACRSFMMSLSSVKV